MTLIKIFISIIVFTSSSLLGMLHGLTFSKRAKNLNDLEYNIRLLESEIVAGSMELPIALENTYQKGKGEIKNIFLCIYDDLIENKREDIFESFLSQKNLLQKTYMLKEEDTSIFLFLGKILGKTNMEDQEKNFQFIIKQIRSMADEANIQKNDNVRLYRVLGVLMGLGIIIITI